MVTLVELAQRIATDLLATMPHRLSHVAGVAATALSVVERGRFEHADEVVAAAWLHDIGYAPAVADTGFHPLDGARYARRAGFPELVVSLVAYHSGAPAEAAERDLSAELAAFVEPPEAVLDVLTFSDMTTGPDGASTTAEARIAEILSRYPVTDPVHRAVTGSAPALLASAARVAALLR